MLIYLVIQSDNGLIRQEISCAAGTKFSEFKESYIGNLNEGWTISVWSENKNNDYVLRDKDRVEVCGPLLVDPKVARMKRAQVKQGYQTSKRRHA